VVALLLFGGSTLKDFAFALLIGVASGAYSSIFIASPVLTHWKEREHGYRLRRVRIISNLGHVPAYADGDDIEPSAKRTARSNAARFGGLDESVSNEEFEQMKRELGLDEDKPRHRTSRMSERLAHTTDAEIDAPTVTAEPGPLGAGAPSQSRGFTAIPTRALPKQGAKGTKPDEPDAGDGGEPSPGQAQRDVAPAADRAENEGVADVRSGPTAPRNPRQRNRRHGRKR
jgi:SecD/SecF fusion protein